MKAFLSKSKFHIILTGLAVVLSLFALSACQTTTPVAAPSAPEISATSPASVASAATATPEPPQVTLTITATVTPTPAPTADTRPDPKQWSSWPVVPTLSAKAYNIYQQGLAAGNDPQAFSVVGDCQSEPNVFLGFYATDRYRLSPQYAYLQEAIDQFQLSFTHRSLSLGDGWGVANPLNSQFADPNQCDSGETPLDCELRLHKPMVVFVNMGTNWAPGASKSFEKYLRQIVEKILAHNAVPILSTKADNIEGDNSLNIAMVQVAHDYDVPLMNFWLSVQNMPNNGLDPARNNVYLTPDAWDRRNFEALLTLYTIWNAANPGRPTATPAATVTATP